MITPSAQTLRDLFVDRVQYVVPVYQRAYVWNAEDHWIPRWEDLRDLTENFEEHRAAQTGHFLGSIVIELRSAAPGRVKDYTVIDGQQRLTTLQLLLAAFCRVAAEHDHDSAKEIEALLVNSGKHAGGDLRFKVLPGRHDRPAFREVMTQLEPSKASPLWESHQFFFEQINGWLAGGDASGINERLDLLHDALDGLLHVVSIQLDGSSDAQVVFETLNSRGADLTSLDLAKNALLHRADREQADTTSLHDTIWEPSLGDADYWLELVRQGRYTRERSDLFLMHWMTMKLGAPPRGQHLFADFRNRILRAQPPPRAEQLIRELCRDAKVLRSFDDFEETTPEGRFFLRLDLMDTTTLLPVALLLFRSGELSKERRQRALAALESWLVRRMLLGSNTRHYNRLLGKLLSDLNARTTYDRADDLIIRTLRAFDNPTDEWPDDREVAERLETQPLYGWINQKRIRMLLEACEQHLAEEAGGEMLSLSGTLTVEHALPQSWEVNWPLPPDVGDLEGARRQRMEHVHRLGNLTLLTQKLNSSVSNAPWPVKRQELKRRSQLLVNQVLCSNETWNEELIDQRSAGLAKRVLEIWPGPSNLIWGERIV